MPRTRPRAYTLTPFQRRVLNALANHDHVHRDVLVGAVTSTRPQITRALNTLADLNLAERAVSADGCWWRPTERGRAWAVDLAVAQAERGQ